jgi:hypothetical protein
VVLTLVLGGAAGEVFGQGSPNAADAIPDYDRVFPQDRVTQLYLQVSAADWQRLVDDMTSMAGEFGGGEDGLGGGPGGGPGGPGGGPGLPPSEATAACVGKVEGEECTFGTPPVAGRCAIFVGALACTELGSPGGGPPPGGGGGPGGGFPGGGGERDDVEFLPRTPLYIPAELTFDGEVFHHVGIRLKGNSTLLNTWRSGVQKYPLRLNMDEFESEFPEIRDQTLFGFQNLNLTNTALDGSYLRAKVGHDLFREAGVPSSAAGFTRVYLDRGKGIEYLGLYTLVEVPDRAFLDTQFGDSSGNLYKPNGAGGRWTEFLEESFPKKTNAAEADWSDVQAAIAALNSPRTDAEAWRAGLEATLNVPGFLRWLAVNTVIGNSDSYGGLAPHNYYLYGDRLQRDRLHWIPWDLDLAFGGGGFGGGPGGGGQGELDLFHERIGADWPLIRFLLDDPIYRSAYGEAVEEALASVFEPSGLAVRLRQEHAMIAPDVVGPDGEITGYTFLQSDEEFDTALAQLISYVEDRARSLRAALDSNR